MKTYSRISCLLLCVVMLFAVVSCGADKPELPAIWNTAAYTEDTTLGEGAKTVTVEVTADTKTIVFTLKTDAETLGAALVENKLVEGEVGEYGLYIKTVIGMLADYDIDQSYWAFYQNGEYASASVDNTPIAGGEKFSLVYTKDTASADTTAAA